MDEITKKLKAMYERYPYPDSPAAYRVSFHVRRVLSYVENQQRPRGAQLHVLDAGCGRGVGLAGQAHKQPDIQFTGVDLASKSLEIAKTELDNLGVKNADIGEGNIMTMEGIEAPEGGFDAIYCSGVLHHLPDPAAGLANLKSVLAGHGVMVIMVYGRQGREPLYRLTRAIDELIPRDRPIEQRLAVGRKLAACVDEEVVGAGPWKDFRSIGDIEFVDRYLNVNETSYDIDGLWGLLEEGGMKFLRWCDPGEWSLEGVLEDPEMRETAAGLPEVARYRLIEQLCWRSKFTFMACHPENELRRLPEKGKMEDCIFAVNPEVTFVTSRRFLGLGTTIVSAEAGVGKPYHKFEGRKAQAADLLSVQEHPFDGESFAAQMKSAGLPEEESMEILAEFYGKDIVYMPHNCDIQVPGGK